VCVVVARGAAGAAGCCVSLILCLLLLPTAGATVTQHTGTAGEVWWPAVHHLQSHHIIYVGTIFMGTILLATCLLYGPLESPLLFHILSLLSPLPCKCRSHWMPSKALSSVGSWPAPSTAGATGCCGHGTWCVYGSTTHSTTLSTTHSTCTCVLSHCVPPSPSLPEEWYVSQHNIQCRSST
jgi:hypothetical protein